MDEEKKDLPVVGADGVQEPVDPEAEQRKAEQEEREKKQKQKQDRSRRTVRVGENVMGVEHGVVVRAQEVRQADLRRAVAPEAADAVLPPHLFGKREADEVRVDAEIPVEPVIFFANFF